ncbi:MAG: glycosyltransferase family 2 protein [Tissierellia bacterium]|nr:glycosyltransferase family 2 protein [Tissierellia bacterium]MDD4781480.1 glycosyltransferase family 2 protein [Tissierellia bacterium]
MTHPYISIIVPYYNSEKYISKCIDSILNQTLSNFELILVDDGSTDNSYNICNTYASKDNRIILLQKENGGQGTARNMGLDIAKGDYIGFVDSDDFIQPEMYSIMYNSCIKNNAEMSICGFNIYRSEKIQPKPVNKHPKKEFNNFELMHYYLTTQIINGGPCNKVYKKSLFNNLRFPPLRMREDSYLMPHIFLKVNKAIYTGDNLYNWHQTLNSTERSKFNLNDLNALESINSLYGVVEKHYPSLIKLVIKKRTLTNVDLMKKILHTNQYKKYKHIYYLLREYICKDYSLNSTNYGENSKRLNKNIEFICRFNYLYIIKETIVGNLKFIVKKLISKI